MTSIRMKPVPHPKYHLFLCIYLFILLSMLSLTISFSTSPSQFMKGVSFRGFSFGPWRVSPHPCAHCQVHPHRPSHVLKPRDQTQPPFPPKNTSRVHPINQIAVKCCAWGKRFSMLGNISYWHQNSHRELLSLMKRGCPFLKPEFCTSPCKVWAQ